MKIALKTLVLPSIFLILTGCTREQCQNLNFFFSLTGQACHMTVPDEIVDDNRYLDYATFGVGLDENGIEKNAQLENYFVEFVDGAEVGDLWLEDATMATISGGTFTSVNFDSSTIWGALRIKGGTMGELNAYQATVAITGGTIEGNVNLENPISSMGGGTIGGDVTLSSGSLMIYGGSIAGTFSVTGTATAIIVSNDATLEEGCDVTTQFCLLQGTFEDASEFTISIMVESLDNLMLGGTP